MLLRNRYFTLGPGNVIADPQALFLKGISEGHVVVHTPDPPAGDPAAKPEAKPVVKSEAKPNGAEAAPLEQPDLEEEFEDDEFDIEGAISSLERRLDQLARPTAPTAAAPVAKAAERTGLRGQIAMIREGLESDDTRTPAMLTLLDNLTERLEAQERREEQREERDAEAAQTEWENEYEVNVVKFGERYPGVGPKVLAAIGRKHVQMIQQDPRAKALTFEEVARRMYGDDALAARKAKGSPAGGGPSPGSNGRTDPPSGSPIPGRSTGGGPLKKFVPGPGRGVSDVTDHLRSVGLFKGVISEK